MSTRAGNRLLPHSFTTGGLRKKPCYHVITIGKGEPSHSHLSHWHLDMGSRWWRHAWTDRCIRRSCAHERHEQLCSLSSACCSTPLRRSAASLAPASRLQLVTYASAFVPLAVSQRVTEQERSVPRRVSDGVLRVRVALTRSIAHAVTASLSLSLCRKACERRKEE